MYMLTIKINYRVQKWTGNLPDVNLKPSVAGENIQE
jgi:hypothetical protein